MSSSLDLERLAILVHELRSPVAALSAIARALAEDELDRAGRRELVRLSTLACRAIERIVGDVAVASIHRETIDPVALARDVVTAARLRGAHVAFVSEEVVPFVDADPARVRQVLDNLITNAVVHGGSDVEISVAVRSDEALRIIVSDAGPGIANDELERIFDAGVRLAPERAGTGIGLALSRSIAEGHGGALTVESRLGHGTAFTLSLPLRDRAS